MRSGIGWMVAGSILRSRPAPPPDGLPEIIDARLEHLRIGVDSVLHQVCQSGSDGVELAVRRHVIASLGVLKKRDQQKSEDRHDRVEHQLPGVDARNNEDRGQPEKH
jgi:hypothetical protein